MDGCAPGLASHIDQLCASLRSPDTGLDKLWRWGELLAGRLLAGHRLLVAGNGGSAAQAQHLTAELVGRYREERIPLSAIPLHADTSSLTAIGNDYGPDEAFARQVAAHGRPGDVFLGLSTSGRSGNVLAAAGRAGPLRLITWAMTGPAPNPLAALSDDALCVAAPDTATIQEVHLVAIHALCAAVDAGIASHRRPPAAEASGRQRAVQPMTKRAAQPAAQPMTQRSAAKRAPAGRAAWAHAGRRR